MKEIINQVAESIGEQQNAKKWIKIIVQDSNLDTIESLRDGGLDALLQAGLIKNLKFFAALRKRVSAEKNVDDDDNTADDGKSDGNDGDDDNDESSSDLGARKKPSSKLSVAPAEKSKNVNIPPQAPRATEGIFCKRFFSSSSCSSPHSLFFSILATLHGCAVQQEPEIHLDGTILFVGNPGAGKSTLLNGLMGKAYFDSGVTSGVGLTKDMQEKVVDGVKYMDTPGLQDAKTMDLAALQIEKALKSGGLFRICFVVSNDAGRLKPADVATIKCVLDAVGKKFPFGVILNKIPLQLSAEQCMGLLEITRQLADKASGRVPMVFPIMKEKNIDDEARRMPPSDVVAGLKSFLKSIPPTSITADEVQKIHTNEFEEVLKKATEKVAQLEKQMKEETEKYKSDVDRLMAALAAKAQVPEGMQWNAAMAREYMCDTDDSGDGKPCCGRMLSSGRQCKNSPNCYHHRGGKAASRSAPKSKGKAPKQNKKK